MKCKLCEKNINSISFYDILFERDCLCKDCRSSLKMNHRFFKTKEYELEFFYDYDNAFKTLLLQYKECYDEALYNTFLYKIDSYINLRYFNYHIIYAPSSTNKIKKRGFDHLRLMFSNVNLKEAKGLEIKKDLDQSHKTYYERQKMVDNFIYKGKFYNNILIVDDVYTTGSTISGIYKAIKPYANNIKILVLAKTKYEC